VAMRGLGDNGDRRNHWLLVGRISGRQLNIFAVVWAVARLVVEAGVGVAAEGLQLGELFAEEAPGRACRSRVPGERSWHS
jgi:hypothetical protein